MSKKELRLVRSVLAGFVIVVFVVGALTSVKALQFKAMGDAAAQQVMPPEPVNAIEVRRERMQPRVASVGSVVAVQGTVVSAEADGVVREIMFEPGTVVKAGEDLVRLDTDVERAQLSSAEAAAKLARVSYTRAKDLIGTRAISRAELDTAEANMAQADAQIENIRAAIDKKVVRAPFTGKLGIRRISVGQFLSKGSPIVSLQSLDPVYVEFSLPQQRLGDLSQGLAVAVTTDAYPSQQFEGTITAVDPDVDPATRNVRVQATLSNADQRLRPGMFVSVDVVLAQTQDVLVIPSTAILHAAHGDSIFVIEEGEADTQGKKALVVRQQPVQLGARQGDFVVATEGVEAGDRIVSTGVFKLRPGTPVVIDNTLAPQFTFAPRPDNT
jgi:membrane fusion protein (multidrug efflux system)